MRPPIPSPFTAARTALPLALAFLGAAVAAAQEADKFQTWTKVEEARETREYKEELRGGGAFGDAAGSFLTQIALPQLESQANRPTIERVRRRIRELLLTDIADEKSHDAANRVVLDFMEQRARDPKAEPEVRVNAMLLVGELRSRDGKPWPAAATTLAAAAGDTTVPMEVRIAALAGLARHAEGRKAAAGSLPQTAADVVTAILTERIAEANQAGGRWRVESDWMAARAASMLPAVTREAPKSTAEGLMTLLQDSRRGFNVRVRAAAALGATAVAASGIDAAKAVDAVRTLAILGIENDLATVDRQRLEDGGREAVVATPDQPLDGTSNRAGREGVPEQVCRRTAWRLATLADAVLTEDGDSGLALLAGDARDPSEKLAVLLRASAAAIDAAPGEKSLTEALVKLGRPPETPAKTPPPSQPKPEQPKAAEPAADPAASPFENPFGN